MKMLKCDYWSWKLNRKRRAKITMRKHLGYTPQFCLRKLEGVEEPDFDKVYLAKIWHNQSVKVNQEHNWIC